LIQDGFRTWIKKEKKVNAIDMKAPNITPVT
jgi:hypothetical protein